MNAKPKYTQKERNQSARRAEALVDFYNKICEEKKVAYVHKIATPEHFREKSTVDFIGHARTGQVILIECKNVLDPLEDFKTSAIKKHQREALDTAMNCGGIALLAIVWGFNQYAQQLHVFPWGIVKDMTKVPPSFDPLYHVGNGLQKIPYLERFI